MGGVARHGWGRWDVARRRLVGLLGWHVPSCKNTMINIGCPCALGQPNFFGGNASNSMGVLGLKSECIPIFITFGHHLTTSLGLRNIALSVVIGLKTQIFTALETWSNDARIR